MNNTHFLLTGQGCRDAFVCGHDMCITNRLLCDKTQNCLDGADELRAANCTSKFYKLCINLSCVLDNVKPNPYIYFPLSFFLAHWLYFFNVLVVYQLTWNSIFSHKCRQMQFWRVKWKAEIFNFTIQIYRLKLFFSNGVKS